MRIFYGLLASIALVWPGPAGALERDEAYRLAREGPPEAIEEAFAAHQAAFDAGEIGPGAYRRPYGVFRTTEPKVDAMLEDWLAAFPGSPQAAAAGAFQRSHIAHLLRGDDYASKTPAAAMDRFREMAAEALELARRALDGEPRHLAAAHRLMTIAAFLGARTERDRAFRIIEELDTPASVLLSGLRFNFARWGGGPEAIRRYCEERAPLVPDISVEECLALADYEQRGQYPERVAAAVATLSKGSEKHFLEQHIAALSRAGRGEEAYELARSRGFMSYELAYWLANTFGDNAYVEEVTARNLRGDPLNPVDLAAYGTMLAERGEAEAAREAFEKAMIYGAHNPFVRRNRILMMARTPGFGGDFLAEIVDALDATDDDMEILGHALHFVMAPGERITHLEDGTPRPDFPCTQLRILERHERACDAGAGHYTCRPGTTTYRDDIIIEARAKGVCGEATGTTWQDIVRYLLNLTE